DRVYPDLVGGGEKVLWELAVHLVRGGHEVHYFGMKLWEGPADIVREGVSLHGVCKAPALYSKAGKRVIGQPLMFALGVLVSLFRNRGRGYDLVDCTVFPYFSCFSVWLFAKLTRTPYVFTWLEVWGADYWRRYLGPHAGKLGSLIE